MNSWITKTPVSIIAILKILAFDKKSAANTKLARKVQSHSLTALVRCARSSIQCRMKISEYYLSCVTISNFVRNQILSFSIVINKRTRILWIASKNLQLVCTRRHTKMWWNWAISRNGCPSVTPCRNKVLRARSSSVDQRRAMSSLPRARVRVCDCEC